MSYPHRLANLTTREAIADAIYRATTAFDENDTELLSSAFHQDIVFKLPGHTMTGLDAVKSQSFNHVGAMDTSHFATNLRINVADDLATTASVTANFLAQHYPSGKGLSSEGRRWLVGGKYFVDMIKDDSDGLWKAKKWVIETVWGEGDSSVMQG